MTRDSDDGRILIAGVRSSSGCACIQTATGDASTPRKPGSVPGRATTKRRVTLRASTARRPQ